MNPTGIIFEPHESSSGYVRFCFSDKTNDRSVAVAVDGFMSRDFELEIQPTEPTAGGQNSWLYSITVPIGHEIRIWVDGILQPIDDGNVTRAEKLTESAYQRFAEIRNARVGHRYRRDQDSVLRRLLRFAQARLRR